VESYVIVEDVYVNRHDLSLGYSHFGKACHSLPGSH
jgi:hypothetical protein